MLAKGRSTISEWSLDLDGFDDLSDTFFDVATGWLWLLSHESKAAAAFDSQGVRVTELVLKKGRHGLKRKALSAIARARFTFARSRTKSIAFDQRITRDRAGYGPYLIGVQTCSNFALS